MALSITNLNPVETTASVNPCQNYVHRFLIEWDKTQGTISYPLNVFIHFLLPEQVSFTLNVGDITFEDADVIQFQKDFEIPRRPATNSVIYVATPTGSVSDEINFTPVSNWDILNITTTTDPNSVTTASVSIASNNTTFLNFETSLDDVTYDATNTQILPTPGDYTIYVRDQYGCIKSQGVTASGTSIFVNKNDYNFISLLNPIAFTKYQPNALSNFSNTLSYAEQTSLNYGNTPYIYPSTDVLKFQFRSNFEVNEVHLLQCGESLSTITPLKVTDNLNQKDIRDMQLYKGADGFIRLFNNGTGSIYTESSEDVFDPIGNNALDGTLIVYQNVGDFIEIQGSGVVEILEIENIQGQGQTLKVNLTTNLAVGSYIVTTYFSRLNYEVYEFELGMNVISGATQLGIVMSSTADFDELNPLDSLVFLSEPFDVGTINEDYFKFTWSNSENNQIIWQTGIECFAYFKKLYNPIFEPFDTNDVYTTDTEKTMLESEFYESHIFVLDALPTNVARQIGYITSSDNLLINGLNYVKEETPEITGLVGSNLYSVSLKLTLSDNYNSNSDSGTEEIINGSISGINGFLTI